MDARTGRSALMRYTMTEEVDFYWCETRHPIIEIVGPPGLEKRKIKGTYVAWDLFINDEPKYRVIEQQHYRLIVSHPISAGALTLQHITKNETTEQAMTKAEELAGLPENSPQNRTVLNMS